MKERIVSGLSFFLGRCYFLCFIFILSLSALVDHQKVIFKTLDYLRDPGYILTYARGEARFFPSKFLDTVRYYKNFNKIFPDSAAANSVLGYCYYRLGDPNRAIFYYKEAIALDPE